MNKNFLLSLVGQDIWFSSRRPEFESRRGKEFFLLFYSIFWNEIHYSFVEKNITELFGNSSFQNFLQTFFLLQFFNLDLIEQ